ncbi:RhuM family protein [Sulfurovum sp.]|uniref:virulence RhuM family protein n=1 Tax=Sulfurovum sp. TaxID=1969726 RepID=UPI0025E552BB|nr:RhuM family protein [Sulfurovum sp.]
MMSDMVIYEDGHLSIEISVEDETIWLSADQIASIFDVNRPAIVKHIGNIYKTEELDKNSTCSILEQVAKDGKKRKMNFYNLDMIIATGYRVNSKKATAFRKWSTNILKDHLIKGYTINKERLQKNYDEFLRVVEDIKVLAQNADSVKAEDVLELIKSFSATWFGLDSYDREELPKEGISKVKGGSFTLLHC